MLEPADELFDVVKALVQDGDVSLVLFAAFVVVAVLGPPSIVHLVVCSVAAPSSFLQLGLEPAVARGSPGRSSLKGLVAVATPVASDGRTELGAGVAVVPAEEN